MTDAPQTPTKKGAAQVGAVLVAASIVAPLTLASEGLVTKTAADPVGIPTACWGHANAEASKTYSLDQCEQVAVIDLAKAGAGIAPCLPQALPDKTRAAFTDAAFNLGSAAFCKSSMAKKAMAGDLKGSCAALSLYVYAGGKPLPGLVKRRAAERALCEEGLAEAQPLPAQEDPPPPAQVQAQTVPIGKPGLWARIRELFS